LVGAVVSVSGSTVLVGAPLRASGRGAAYVFSLVGGQWSQSAELIGADSESGGWFGYSVSVNGTTAIVGAPSQATNGTAYVFSDSTGQWTQTAELAAIPTSTPADFGSAVAVSGETAVVGAWQNSAGAAYVFTDTAGNWTQSAQLQATDLYGGDDLGASVAISGNNVAVGGVLKYGSYGAVYVFTATGGVWTLTSQLAPLQPGNGSFFSSKSLAMVGSTIMVGAAGHGGGPGHGTPGEVYWFTDSSGSWTQQTVGSDLPSYTGDQLGSSVAVDGYDLVLGAPGEGDGGRAYLSVLQPGVYTPTLSIDAYGVVPGDRFGASVALSGLNAVVGAPGHDGTGAAYVFTETTSVPYTAGTVRCLPGPLGPAGSFTAGECRAWLEYARLGGSGLSQGDAFGEAVSVSKGIAVVGAPGHSTSGAAYVFEKRAVGWHQVKKLVGSDTMTGDGFGTSVSSSSLNRTVVVGAPGHSGGGRAYIFTESSGGWSEVAELVGTDTTAGDGFGSSVSLSSSTNTVLVGAPDHGGGTAYVFTDAGGAWSEVGELVGADTTAGDGFAASVSLSGNVAVVGAPGHGGIGEMYVFTTTSGRWSQVAGVGGSDSSPGDGVGTAVAVAPRMAVAGAPRYSRTAPEGGVAYVYTIG
jgi:hypothetical protein